MTFYVEVFVKTDHSEPAPSTVITGMNLEVWLVHYTFGGLIQSTVSPSPMQLALHLFPDLPGLFLGLSGLRSWACQLLGSVRCVLTAGIPILKFSTTSVLCTCWGSDLKCAVSPGCLVCSLLPQNYYDRWQILVL